MGPSTSGTENNTLADMVNEMAKEAKRGATTLMDEVDFGSRLSIEGEMENWCRG